MVIALKILIIFIIMCIIGSFVASTPDEVTDSLILILFSPFLLFFITALMILWVLISFFKGIIILIKHE